MLNDDVTQTAGLWPPEAKNARLHFVTGKGGTGKTTLAASLALALAADGKKVLLVETEMRQGLAQLFDIAPLTPVDTKLFTAEGGGELWALALDIEHALLEYLDMFYNLGFAGRAIKRVGAIDFVTTVAPGLRDVLITGKIKECVVRVDDDGRRVYDAVVVDAPPTGRIGNFLDVTSAMRDLTKTGPISSQSDGVVTLLKGPETVVHLTTLLEAMPIQETVEAVAELREKDMRLGAILLNRVNPTYLPADEIDAIAEGQIDADRVRQSIEALGEPISDDDLAGLLTESIQHATRLQAQQVAKAQLDEVELPMIEIPTAEDGIDVGALYSIAGLLQKVGA